MPYSDKRQHEYIAYYANKIHVPQNQLGYIFRKVIQNRSFKGRY